MKKPKRGYLFESVKAVPGTRVYLWERHGCIPLVCLVKKPIKGIPFWDRTGGIPFGSVTAVYLLGAYGGGGRLNGATVFFGAFKIGNP